MTANSWVRNPRLSEMPQNAQQWRDFVLELQFTNQDNQSGRYLAVDGNLALPSFAFLDDPDTGIYQLTAGSLGISGNGALIISFTDGSPGSINPKQAFYHIDGTNLAPSYAFLLDANTGMYRVSSGRLGFTSNNTLRFEVTPTGSKTTGDAEVTGDLTTAGRIETVTNYTFADTPVTLVAEEVIVCDTSGGNIVMNLPAVSANDGRRYVIANSSLSSGNVVQLIRNGSDTINGITTLNVAVGHTQTLVGDTTNSDWVVTATAGTI